MNTTTTITQQIITQSLRRSCLHSSLPPLLSPKKITPLFFCLQQPHLTHKPPPTTHINKLSEIHSCKYLNRGFLFKRYYITDSLLHTEFSGVSGDTDYDATLDDHQFYNEVRRLCKQGKITKAIDLFERTPSIYAAEIILRESFGTKESYVENAFEVYQTLTQYFTPTPTIFLLLLHHCKQDPQKCAQVMSEMELYGIEMSQDMFEIFCDAVYYSKKLSSALKLLKAFSKGFKFIPSSSSCQQLLSVFSSFGYHVDALQLMHLMDGNNITINLNCFLLLIIACLKTPEGIESGKKVHQRLTETPFLSYKKVFNLLLLMYSKTGSLGSIDTLFIGKEGCINDPDFWTMIFEFHAEFDGHLGIVSLFWDRVVVNKSFTPDSKILTLVLNSCRKVGPASQFVGAKISEMIHVDEQINDFKLMKALLIMYTECGFDIEAYNLYFKFKENYTTFSTRIRSEFLRVCLRLRKRGSLQITEELKSALNQIYEMVRFGDSLAPYFVPNLLRLYASFGDYSMTKLIFDQSPSIFPPILPTSFYHTILKTCGELGPVALPFGKLIDEEIIQQKLVTVDVPLLSLIVQMYFNCGDHQTALKRFEQYEELKEYPPQLAFLYALRACSKIGPPAFEIGKKTHHRMKKRSKDFVDSETIITMIGMYTNCGKSELALMFYYAINKFEQYQKTERIALAALQACTSPQYLEQGKQIHKQWSSRRGLTPKILTELITMYARCGCFEVSKELFQNTSIREDPLVWKAIFQACSLSNDAEFAVECFNEMKKIGIELNDEDAFLDLMRVCNSSGLFETSLNYAEEMQRLGLIPSKDHTDLLHIAQNAINQGQHYS